MSLGATIYKTLFQRSSTFFLTIVAGAFVLEAGIGGLSDAIFESVNRGKLWDHIKDNYTPKEE